ncbi:quinol monooxygenase YgiN [Paraburkholderia sp. GAS33]|jgi:quinol monooxygenase YgiN
MKRLIRVVILVMVSCFCAGGANMALADATSDTANGPVVVVVHLDIVRPQVSQALPIMRGYLATTRQEHGIRNVELLLQVGTDNHFTVVETWDDRAAYDAHNASQAIRDYRTRIFPFLASPYDDRIHTEISAS